MKAALKTVRSGEGLCPAGALVSSAAIPGFCWQSSIVSPRARLGRANKKDGRSGNNSLHVGARACLFAR